MRLSLVALCLALPLAVPAAAQAPSPEDAVMSTLDACQSIERGSSPAAALTAVSYTAPRQGEDRWTRWIGDRMLYVGLTDKPQANGKVYHFCSVGVQGRLAAPARLQGLIEARARSLGYTIAPPKPRPAGGTTQSMTGMTATGMTGLSLIINDAADRAGSASFVVTHGWTR